MTDERFFAWLDGELPPAEAAEMEAKVEADPSLKAEADRHRAMIARMRFAFDSVASQQEEPAEQPMPAKVIDFAAAREKRQAGRPARMQWAALAATLCVGLLTTAVFIERNPNPAAGSKTTVAGPLGEALNTQLAGASPSAVQIGLTFRDKSGAICRTYAQPGSSGLACNEHGGWRIRGSFPSSKQASEESDYRMAAGLDPRLGELVDRSIAGEAFDKDQETNARRGGWR